MSPPPPSSTPNAGSRWLLGALVGTDAVAASIAWAILLAVAPRAADVPTGAPGTLPRSVFLALVVGLTMAALAVSYLYQSWACVSRVMETTRLLRAVFAVGLGALLLEGRLERRIGLAWVVAGSLLSFVLLALGRTGYRSYLQAARRHGRFVRPVAIVGASDEAVKLYHQLAAQPELGFRPVGVVGDRRDATRLQFPVPWLAEPCDPGWVAVLHRVGITGVAIAASGLAHAEYNRVVRDALDAGLHVQISGGLYGISTRRLRNSPIGRQAAFYLTPTTLSGWQAATKRVMDVALSLVGIVLSAPVMLVAGFLVRRHDGGPALFKQQRVGRGDELFTMYKLRTMVVDAESRLDELQAANERSGPLFKVTDDPRMTPIGRVLDTTSLNELPQLFNVLKGDMSLVGPRPALQREVATFHPDLLKRHRVRPGITGLWQVESRDSSSFSAYQGRDLYYVENWTVFLDVAILLATCKAVLSRAGALFRRHNGVPEAVPEDGTPMTAPPVPTGDVVGSHRRVRGAKAS